MTEGTFSGSDGEIFYRRWDPDDEVRRIVMIVHGYAEHSGRYAHVAEALASRGAVVIAEDHIGHGHSAGERALITDFEHVVDDLQTLAGLALATFPGAPLIVAGHSMGGLLASRFVSTDPLVYRERYKRPLLEAEVVALDRFGEEIDRVDVPVLFLHGADDPFVDYRTSLAAAKAFPTRDLTVRVYPGARHELVNELNRDEVIGEIVAFAERVAP